MMNVGEVQVIPMKTKLPVIEAFGDGYKSLIHGRQKIKYLGKFFVTKSAAKLLSDLKSITLTEDSETNLVIVSSKHYDE